MPCDSLLTMLDLHIDHPQLSRKPAARTNSCKKIEVETILRLRDSNQYYIVATTSK
jgi:hypothetical protein